MKNLSIHKLAQIIKAKLDAGYSILDTRETSIKTLVSSISIDSRTVKKGDCFFAIKGENFDGHDYVADALAKGAVCAVVNTSIEHQASSIEILKVNDTIKALGSLAAWYRSNSNFKVVAITGSVGKTTTKQILSHVLKKRFRLCSAVKNFNNQIGVPLTLLAAKPDDEIVITELGTNHPGEIGLLAEIVKPDIAVIANVGIAHLQGFGNLQNIIDEKISISKGLVDNGKFIINGDYEQLVSTCRNKGIKFTTFGTNKYCDIAAANISYNHSSSSFTLDGVKVTISLPGKGNLENALAGWSVCKQLGIKLDEFAQALKTVPPVAERAELLKIGTLTVLNDCYNANPASMKNALDILEKLGSDEKGRLIFICGDMAELGADSEKFHAKLGEQIAKTKVELVIAVGDFARIAAETARANSQFDLKTEFFKNADFTCNNLEKIIKDYDIILVKGSRTVKLEQVIGKLKEIFGDPGKDCGIN